MLSHRTRSSGSHEDLAAADSWDWGAVLRLCRREVGRYLSEPADVEDATQEAAIRAWRKRARCRSAASADAWARQIARNEGLRAAARRSSALARTGSAAEPDTVWDDADADLVLTVRQHLARLPAADRRVLTLRYADDLTQSEIAARLSIPEGTVKIRLHRARRRLRDQLSQAEQRGRTPGIRGHD
jgi:RNA polymerase sigma-70 factor (ECF subfamily)